MLNSILVLGVDGDSAANALEANPGTVSDPTSPAQFGGNHQLALGRDHSFQSFHILHSNMRSKTWLVGADGAIDFPKFTPF